MKKANLFILLLMLLVNSAILADMPMESGKCERKWRKNITKGLELTKEQEEKFTEIQKAKCEETAKLFDVLKEKRANLKGELNKPDVSRDKIQPLIEEIKSQEAKLMDSRINNIFAIKEILSPEQFSRFQQNKQRCFKDKKCAVKEGKNRKHAIKK